jgi:thioredoxin 1|tara:strand:- start:18435 stop:18755 length:321 start_codon:yes stop_codon:yes gene_type:complete
MGKAIEITDSNFNDLISKNKTVLVDFWAEWCGPCRMIGPIVEELAGEYDGRAIIGKLDVDTNQESSVKYGVRSIPTILLFKDGELVDRQVGAVPKETLSKAIDAQL